MMLVMGITVITTAHQKVEIQDFHIRYPIWSLVT